MCPRLFRKRWLVKMATYKCLECNKKVADSLLSRRVRCPYCGSKMLYKPRLSITKVRAL